MNHVLVLGTRNRKKLAELNRLLGDLPVTLRTLDDFPNAIEVDETGATFRENAALKATRQATHLKQWVLGEDSGLVVAALGGAPGIFSARYSGPSATDSLNNQLLLERMRDVPVGQRHAHYVCHAALSDPTGVVRAFAEDYCHGSILFEAQGTGGFGYDPLFQVAGSSLTFGELSSDEKAAISHRSRAIRKLRESLTTLYVG